VELRTGTHPLEAVGRKGFILKSVWNLLVAYAGFITKATTTSACVHILHRKTGISEQRIEIGVRSMSRYLKILTVRGLLRRVGKKYRPTDLARNQEYQDRL
jgi:hypothetical protein